MAKISNYEFLTRIFTATEQDRIDWQSTAKPREFTASFGGRWTLVILQEYMGSPAALNTALYVRNSEGETIVTIDSEQDVRVEQLHELARRHALKIDDALVDLLGEIEKPEP
jgi:hypothetical protein